MIFDGLFDSSKTTTCEIENLSGAISEIDEKKVGCGDLVTISRTPSIWVAMIGTFKSRYLVGDSKYHQSKLKTRVARGNAKPRRGAACLDCISFRVRLKERKSNQISTQKKRKSLAYFTLPTRDRR